MKIFSSLAVSDHVPSNLCGCFRSFETKNPQIRNNTLELTGTLVDTVAIEMSGTMYLLLSNPDKLQKLTHEVRAAITSEEDITLANVNGLKYLNAILQEAMRLWPAGPETTRRETDSRGRGQMIQGKWVPPGTLVGVYHWVAGRYTGAWLDAEKFVPERWLSAEVIGESEQGGEKGVDEYAKYHDYDDHGVINSFHVGPRNCVGQNLAMAQMRLVLTGLIWGFEMSLEDGGKGRWRWTGLDGHGDLWARGGEEAVDGQGAEEGGFVRI